MRTVAGFFPGPMAHEHQARWKRLFKYLVECQSLQDEIQRQAIFFDDVADGLTSWQEIQRRSCCGLHAFEDELRAQLAKLRERDDDLTLKWSEMDPGDRFKKYKAWKLGQHRPRVWSIQEATNFGNYTDWAFRIFQIHLVDNICRYLRALGAPKVPKWQKLPTATLTCFEGALYTHCGDLLRLAEAFVEAPPAYAMQSSKLIWLEGRLRRSVAAPDLYDKSDESDVEDA